MSRGSSPNSTCWVAQVSIPSRNPRAEPLGEGAEGPRLVQPRQGQVRQALAMAGVQLSWVCLQECELLLQALQPHLAFTPRRFLIQLSGGSRESGN